MTMDKPIAVWPCGLSGVEILDIENNADGDFVIWRYPDNPKKHKSKINNGRFKAMGQIINLADCIRL